MLQSNILYRAQASQNKRCREIIGTLFSFVLILGSIIGICAISIKDPFDVSTAKDFLFCYMASMIWSLLFGEFLATIVKSWLVWIASSKNFDDNKKPEQGFWIKFAMNLLTIFPCLLPTEL